jgi:DNA-binding transcriptional LysR family regulator
MKGLAFADWDHESLLLVLPEDHSLARIRKLQWQHLQGLPWVMISRQEAPAFRDHFSKLIESHGLAVQIAQESDTVQSVLIMVAAGIGASMVTQRAKNLIAAGVVFRKLPQPQPVVHYAFAYRTGQDSPTLDKFLALLRKSAR